MAKFSSRELKFNNHNRAELDQYIRVVATVLAYNPNGLSDEKLCDEIDMRIEAAGSLEMAAEMADAEFEVKN